MTKIEWTDETWNPTTGCDRVSPGCDRCYALGMAKRLKAMGHPKYQRDGSPSSSGPGFGASVHPSTLDQPLRWRRPRRVFVDSMSDLFHAEIPDDYIADVWAVMMQDEAQKHTFQILTKRPGRARSLLSSKAFCDLATWKAHERAAASQPRYGSRGTGPSPQTVTWPLPNVWLGVSAEDQKWADVRIPVLLDTPAAVRFISAEPLLGPVNFRTWQWCDRDRGTYGSDGHRFCRGYAGHADDCWTDVRPALDWVIVGGESGAGARPMHPDWVRSIRDQCSSAGVAFLFKQWGEFAPGLHDTGSRKGVTAAGFYSGPVVDGQFTGAYASVSRIGKKAAGRELDGRTWDEFPSEAR